MVQRRKFVAAVVAAAGISVLAVPDLAFGVKLRGRALAVYVDNMHCKTCAKKIARKLYTVPGVVAVHVDVKKNVAVITPQNGTDPSPRAIWEAVEAAKFQPVKLVGPRGTYKTKPKG